MIGFPELLFIFCIAFMLWIIGKYHGADKS